jgi:hypothetical protein
MREINELGNRYGRLVVKERIYSGPDYERVRKNSNKAAVWRCECDCGNEVYERGPVLRKGVQNKPVRSCGCWQQDTVAIHAARNAPPILVLEDEMAKELIKRVGQFKT